MTLLIYVCLFLLVLKKNHFLLSLEMISRKISERKAIFFSSEIFREVNAGEVQLLSYAIIINCSLINYFRIMKKSQHHQPNKKK